MNRRTSITVLSALALVATGGLLIAGPLSPPAGPVTSTYKPLSDVEPRIAINAVNTPGDSSSVFLITQPGSYYLTGNVQGVAGKHGIQIIASNVTVDLNGFAVIGAPGSLDGITSTDDTVTAVKVCNGSVRGWGNQGIDLFGSGFVVEDVTVQQSVIGMRLGPQSRVLRCTASDNTGSGISIGAFSQVIGCVAVNNQTSGIFAGDNSLVAECIAASNLGPGIVVALGSTVRACVARSNSSDGIRANAANLLIDNVCSGNGAGAGDGAGINVTRSDNRIERNNCIANDRGIDVDASGNVIFGNTCSGNTVNWALVANNVYGPIVDRTAPASAAVSGNAATDASGSSHPHANFSY